MPETILVVDDEPNYRLILGQVLEAQGYEILEAGSGREAFELFWDNPQITLVLTDITMPDGDGLELLTKVKNHRTETPVIMLTAHIDVKLAVEAMQKGAFDYLTKPYHNEDLIRSVSKALEVSRLTRQNMELRAALAQRHSFGSLIGKSKSMLELYQLLEKVAPTKANVLITGESGTGKELVARAIHYNSPRARNSFVAVNCSALSETLLVSELFGYEKGAYTGAGTGRAGRFELAHQGTLFLDEVGEMGQSAQVTLLRVLQERTIERVGGGGKLIEVDVRLISATNRNLKKESNEGRFREDLFYRLNVVHLKIPPLRERLDDLPILVEHFLDKFGGDHPKKVQFHSDTKRLLYGYHWPGNVRELENVIERALVLASGDVILPSDLPEELQRPVPFRGGPGQSHGSSPSADGKSGGRTAAGESPASTVDSGWRFRDDFSDAQNDLSDDFSKSQSGRSPDDHDNFTGGENIIDQKNNIDLKNKIAQKNIFGPAPSTVPPPDGRRPFIRPQTSQEFHQGSYQGSYQGGEAPVDELSTNSKSPKWVAEILDSLPKEVGLNEALSAFEEALLRKAMSLGGQVQNRAADLLGLKRNSFKYKWDKYAKEPPSALSEILMEFAPEPGDLASLSAGLEEEMLRRSLVQARGVHTQAEDILGLKRNVIQY
ncbi:MAG: sigma 54-interacting transcriptional regulator, partial [Deltaproteobacteria bacterium]|nr:sigma 54-interacting transcriptional regulator [Deltaproteobacteria bacterium]